MHRRWPTTTLRCPCGAALRAGWTGLPARAFACWDDPEQLCVAHNGRHHRGPIPHWSIPRPRSRRCAAPPCQCRAYDWPHRPGGGLCRWPEPPLYRLTTPAGTHRWPRIRRPKWAAAFPPTRRSSVSRLSSISGQSPGQLHALTRVAVSFARRFSATPRLGSLTRGHELVVARAQEHEKPPSRGLVRRLSCSGA